MSKPTRETIRKRVATRRRNAAKRKRIRELRRYDTMGVEQAAAMRLELAGASSTASVQRRVRALAAEINLAPADIRKMLYKRINTGDMLAFCKKHELSIDWLMCGDLKGLQRMIQRRRGGEPPTTSVTGFGAKLARLSESDREIVRKIVEQFADGEPAFSPPSYLKAGFDDPPR